MVESWRSTGRPASLIPGPPYLTVCASPMLDSASWIGHAPAGSPRALCFAPVANAPSTPATRLLRQMGVSYTEHLYRYEERGGTRVSARELGADEHEVVKTLVMEDDAGLPLVVLMHGDREVSTKALARQTGRRSVQICKPEAANRYSGYQVGGTSPLGTRKSMPVFMERSIAALPRIYVNGGSRGFLVGLAPADLVRILAPTLVDAAAVP
jgi:Cys-tRNA(Pro) deacylase